MALQILNRWRMEKHPIDSEKERERPKKIPHLTQASVKSLLNVTSYRLVARGAPRVKGRRAEKKKCSDGIVILWHTPELSIEIVLVACALMEMCGARRAPNGTYTSPGASGK